MGAQDTGMGGEAREFPITSWSLVAGVQASSEGQRRSAVEGLCRRYWKPVYHFVRRAWSKSSEDAKDLTQAFFLQLVEGEALRRYAPERGGFRTYLKVLLRGFAADQHDAMNALKRGGAAKVLALEGGEAPLKDLLPDAQAESPERLFDWAWKKEVLERGMERTRRWFEESGRGVQFRAFEEYEVKGAGSYAQVGAALGVGEGDVRNYLYAVKERLRTEIRAELAQTVTDREQLEEEWRDLFG